MNCGSDIVVFVLKWRPEAAALEKEKEVVSVRRVLEERGIRKRG